MKKLTLLLMIPWIVWGVTIKVASYNVENLFDLHKDGTEYTEFIPNTGYGWNAKAFAMKVTNISQVICDLKPDLIGLQEIESDRALSALQKGVASCGWHMPYRAIADAKATTVKTALLSRYPIVAKDEIDPDGTFKTRNILEATLDIGGKRLKVFVNHWKSRSGPESRRIISAKALMKRLKSLAQESEYILLGDFNSDWKEWKSLPKNRKLNDTHGVTGINHILMTIKDGKPVTKRTITYPYHYDLWYELPPQRRWSHNFFGRKTALDHIIVPATMFDRKSLNYVDQSFHVFKPYYLFMNNGAIYRWQRAKRGYGKHLNEGYSDHLPIYALFSTKPFNLLEHEHKMVKKDRGKAQPKDATLALLYEASLGEGAYRIEDAVVIYKKGRVAIVKRPNDRGMLIYGYTAPLELGGRYDLLITKLDDYKGLREITRFQILDRKGVSDIKSLLLRSFDDLSDPHYVNEVLTHIDGTYKRGYLYYAKGKKIKLYVRKRAHRPKNGSHVTFEKVRVGHYRGRNELILD